MTLRKEISKIIAGGQLKEVCQLVKERLEKELNNGFITDEYFKERIYKISTELSGESDDKARTYNKT